MLKIKRNAYAGILFTTEEPIVCLYVDEGEWGKAMTLPMTVDEGTKLIEEIAGAIARIKILNNVEEKQRREQESQ